MNIILIRNTISGIEGSKETLQHTPKKHPEKKSRSASKESTRLAQDTKKYTDTVTGLTRTQKTIPPDSTRFLNSVNCARSPGMEIRTVKVRDSMVMDSRNTV